MKNKMKMEISDSSDNDDTKANFPNENGSPDKKSNSNNLKNKTSEQSPVGENNNCDETSSNNSSGSESSSEKIPNENRNLKDRKNSSDETSHTVNSIFNAKELTSDDEIYFLQCPENFKKQDLCNKNLDLTKASESISCDGEIYKVELLNSDNKFITLAVPEKTNNGSLIKLPFRGHIIVQKDVNIVPSESEKVSDPRRVVFPSEIKVRHPLLGAEWESYIELANNAINKYNSTNRKSKKVKKEKKKKKEKQEVENKISKRKNSETETHVHKKKKKKHDE